MTRATDILRSIRTGKNAADGINYQIALSTAEQSEFTDYVSILAINEMEKGAGKLFDAFFSRLTDIEKFFVLIEVYCCDEKYTRMTSGELAMNDILVSIVAADSKLKKNISTGDIKIERPGRSSATGMTSIEMKNVEFVSDNVIRYQRRKAVSTLKTLESRISMVDIVGSCGAKYFIKQWDRLIKKYI